MIVSFLQVDDLTKQGARIGLNLNIRAPVIFVPQGPQSSHTLVANLGDLLISNSLEEADSMSGGRSLVDHISVQLFHVTVSRYVAREFFVLFCFLLLFVWFFVNFWFLILFSVCFCCVFCFERVN